MPATHSSVWWPRHPVFLELGQRRYDLTTRALVIGILNRTTDSFYDRGSYFNLDRFFERAEQLVREGADLLDVGGVKAGPGPEVTEDEELERVVPVIASLRERFDLPLSVDTWRASVAAAAFEAGAVVGNDISGFADPGYLPAAAAAGASVVATHIRLSPRVADPAPQYDDVVAEVERYLLVRAERAHVHEPFHPRLLCLIDHIPGRLRVHPLEGVLLPFEDDAHQMNHAVRVPHRSFNRGRRQHVAAKQFHAVSLRQPLGPLRLPHAAQAIDSASLGTFTVKHPLCSMHS